MLVLIDKGKAYEAHPRFLGAVVGEAPAAKERSPDGR
jgi:hypothetical protein